MFRIIIFYVNFCKTILTLRNNKRRISNGRIMNKVSLTLKILGKDEALIINEKFNRLCLKSC